MSRPHAVLILFLFSATAFILYIWRSSIRPLTGEILSALDTQAEIKSRFKLSSVRVDGFNSSNPPEVEFIVTGKWGNLDGWGAQLPNIEKNSWIDPEKVLGKSNLQIIANLGRQFRAHGIISMQKEPAATIFRDKYGIHYLRWRSRVHTTSKLTERVLRQPLSGTLGGGWLIYR